MIDNVCPENDNGQSVSRKSWQTIFVRQSISRKSWWTIYVQKVMMDNLCPDSHCLFVLRLNVPVNNFQSCRDGATASWVINQYFQGVKCLAQGHNTAAVGFEPPTSRSGVRHSTTEPRAPPRQSWWSIYVNKVMIDNLCPESKIEIYD